MNLTLDLVRTTCREQAFSTAPKKKKNNSVRTLMLLQISVCGLRSLLAGKKTHQPADLAGLSDKNAHSILLLLRLLNQYHGHP